jgi:hypothetical protein
MRILLALEWYDHRIHRGVATVAREQGWHLTCTVGQPCLLYTSPSPRDH